MTQPSRPNCPHLGLATDRESCLLYADSVHRCFAQGQGQRIGLEHQESYCLNGRYRSCPRFVEPPERKQAAAPPKATQPGALPFGEQADLEDLPPEFSPWRVALWTLVGLVLVLVVVYYGASIFGPTQETATPVGSGLQPTPAPTVTLRPTDTPASTPTPLHFLQPTVTPTAPPGGANFALSPAAGQVGWVVSSETRGNHFGDSNIYSGVFDGLIYHGAIQFDLSVIPRGAPIHAASLQLTGLTKNRLGHEGIWELRILTDTMDYGWPSATYQDIHNATVVQSVAPALSVNDLDVRQANPCDFNREQIDLLAERVLDEGKISLRLDGPFAGDNSLFSWDSGYGPESLGLRPVLFLSVGPPPATPPPRDYVVVTNTPTPENVLTAAAMVARATVNAVTTGTATPTPRNLVTATPEEWVVVTSTPVPENAATAMAMVAQATAMALTTGTATPTPPNVVTVTPSPTFVMITSVPTPENALTAAARAVATAQAAETNGTPTPLPANWITPIIVTNTPVPGHAATARAVLAQSTAIALTAGTATPTPPNVLTATPSPTMVMITTVATPENAVTAVARAMATATAVAAQATINALITGTPMPTPLNVVTATPTPWVDVNAVVYPNPTFAPALTPTPNPHIIPSFLIGRIGFMSDRDGGEPWYYIMDQDGSNVQRLTGPDAYNAALVRDTLDPTGQDQVVVTQPRHVDKDPRVGENHQLNLRRLADGYEWYITGGTKGADYAPAYCQADPRYIAYTSQETDDDDIFVVDLLSAEADSEPLRTARLTHNEWPWDKHPSWSPDCKQIAFHSNRDGHDQIWIMDFEGMDYPGGNLRNLSDSPYNDWDPVWFKAPPARPE